MPTNEETQDPKPATPEELAELRQAKAELDALKPGLVLTFKDGDKTEQVDTSTAEGRKRAAELGSAGYHLAQKAAALNQEKAALDATVKERVEAELQARGQSHDAAGAPVDVEKLIADTPELAKAIEDGDVKAFNQGLTKVLKAALKAGPKSEQPSGATEEQLKTMQRKTEQSILFQTRVRPNPQFVALAKHLAEVNGVTQLEAEALIVSKMAGVDTSTIGDMTADQVILEKVVKPWSERLGLKPAQDKTERDDSGRFKETAPAGSRQSGNGGGADAAPKFTQPGELDAWLEKEKNKKARTGQWTSDKGW
jgi:hypothetical protein